jgi:poly(beta-D-mannuronate) lyase
MKSILVLIGLFVLPAFCSKAFATDYPVGSVSEFNAALSKAKAGDVIIWKEGNYKDLVISFQPKQNGKEGKPIVLKAQTPGKVILTGSSQIFLSGNFLQVEGFLFDGASTLGEKESAIKLGPQTKAGEDASHCRVTNCAIVNYTRTEESGVDNNYIALEGTYNEIDHCHFTGKTNKGPTVVVNYAFDKKTEKEQTILPQPITMYTIIILVTEHFRVMAENN